MVYKVYSTFSARRFSCDLADAYDKRYLENDVPGMKVNEFFESEAVTPVLLALIRRTSLPLKMLETTFAVDSTGFSTCRFVRWFDEKYGQERSGREWMKAHVYSGTRSHIVTDVRILGKDAADCPDFKPLVEATAQTFRIDEVLYSVALHHLSGLLAARRSAKLVKLIREITDSGKPPEVLDPPATN